MGPLSTGGKKESLKGLTERGGGGGGAQAAAKVLGRGQGGCWTLVAIVFVFSNTLFRSSIAEFPEEDDTPIPLRPKEEVLLSTLLGLSLAKTDPGSFPAKEELKAAFSLIRSKQEREKRKGKREEKARHYVKQGGGERTAGEAKNENRTVRQGERRRERRRKGERGRDEGRKGRRERRKKRREEDRRGETKRSKRREGDRRGKKRREEGRREEKRREGGDEREERETWRERRREKRQTRAEEKKREEEEGKNEKE